MVGKEEGKCVVVVDREGKNEQWGRYQSSLIRYNR
jgi:hypothetical protein